MKSESVNSDSLDDVKLKTLKGYNKQSFRFKRMLNSEKRIIND
jgi:hypothetical protein